MPLTSYLSSLSLIPAFILSFFLIRKADKEIYPILIYIILSTLIDLISSITSYYGLRDYALANIYTILEYLILLAQLFFWKFLDKNVAFYIPALLILVFLWLFELLHGINLNLFSWSMTLSGFLLVIFYTLFLNSIIYDQDDLSLLRPKVIISLGIIIYFTFELIVSIFLNNDLKLSATFTRNILLFHNFVNIFTSGIYTYATICLLRK